MASLVKSPLPPWLVRHAPALGLSTSGLIPDEPFITSNLLLSLSGFYFKRDQQSLESEVPVAENDENEPVVQSKKHVSVKQAVNVKTKAVSS
jgi:hypothetical protein